MQCDCLYPSFAGIHCAYRRRDGQAELTWVAWLDTQVGPSLTHELPENFTEIRL